MPRRAEALEVGTKRKGETADTHWKRAIDLESGEAAAMVRDWKKKACYGVPDVLLAAGRPQPMGEHAGPWRQAAS